MFNPKIVPGLTWWSFKHATWATIEDEPVTARGYYTIKLSRLMEGSKKTYRRYNKKRIQEETRFLKKAEKEGILACCVFMQ